ncbi:MAG: nucleoside triphosphate pyrophosphohydrolase [Gemmatimonadetes bacterium]|nr:nucleoside triphosphate pyrophosphohydrolase [Gemmatimonadota bacterium]
MRGEPDARDDRAAGARGPSRRRGAMLDRALALVEHLREHCPWDRAQTPESLVPYLLEEAAEVADAIGAGNEGMMESEVGDLLLHVAFQIVLAEERGAFDRESVVARLEQKMEERHPHVYRGGEPEAWESMKAQAREREGRGVLDGLSHWLDPILRAHRIQERVSGVGFDWTSAHGAWEKVAEELDEVQRALLRSARSAAATAKEAAARADEPSPALVEELGDLLFAVVNLTRLSGVHAALALQHANAKFQDRFEALERLAAERGVRLGEAPLDVLDSLWEEVKARTQALPSDSDATPSF